MLKSKHLPVTLVTASILFVPTTAFSRSQTVAISPTTEPICYMQTADGRTVNLSNLCAKKPKTQAPQVVVTDVKQEDDFMVGRVVNNSNKTVANARVNYEVLGEDGRVIENGSIATEPATLNPGQSATFEAFMASNTKVRTTSVEWSDK